MFPFVPSHTPRYLSIDGGTSTAGLCYFYIEDNVMVVERTKLLDMTKVDNHYDTLIERHGVLSARLRRMHDAFSVFLAELPIVPALTYYESHFINPRRPTSVIPLVRFMQVVDTCLVDRHIPMTTVAPQQMKRTVGIATKLAKADKDAVKNAISKLIADKKIKLLSDIDIEMISEHEIDAIGIGYAGLMLDEILNERS